MKVKLLKMVREKYSYKWKNSMWTIYIKKDFPIAWAETTHKAVDIMATPLLALSQITKWYRKIYRLHGDWGKFTFYK